MSTLAKCSPNAEDSIEHYCRCPTVLKAANCVLRIDYPSQVALDVWTLNCYWVEARNHLASVAILIYGAYNASNKIRHQGISSKAGGQECLLVQMFS